MAAGRIIEMREKDHYDGKLLSLDAGNLGENDMGVKVHFQNVWFRYPTRDVPILNGLSMTVGTWPLSSWGLADDHVNRLRRASLPRL